MKAKLSQLLKVAPVAVMAAAAPMSHAAFDVFLKIEGVQGDSTDAKHPGEIVVFSFSQGGENTYDLATQTTGKPTLSALNFMTRTSKASPGLFLSCANGHHYTTAKLVCRKSGGVAAPVEFYSITLTDVVVTSFQQSASSGGDDAPTESFTLSFAAIEWAFVPQDDTGKTLPPIKANFDLRTVK